MNLEKEIEKIIDENKFLQTFLTSKIELYIKENGGNNLTQEKIKDISFKEILNLFNIICKNLGEEDINNKDNE